MSFQWIIDYATNISMERKQIVSSTTSRGGITRTVARGSQIYKFDVTLPDGLKWTTLRPLISQAEKLDKVTTAKIKLNDPGHDYIVGYQGNASAPQTFKAQWLKNTNFINIVQGGGALTSGYMFRAGDFIQLGTNGHVYNVTEDVPYNTYTVRLHREIMEESNSLGTAEFIKVGQECEWTVKCINFPSWTIYAHDQVSWSGAFTFVEEYE